MGVTALQSQLTIYNKYLWEGSIHRALSSRRHNDRNGVDPTMPLDASVDQTDARNAAAVRKPGTSIVRFA